MNAVDLCNCWSNFQFLFIQSEKPERIENDKCETSKHHSSPVELKWMGALYQTLWPESMTKAKTNVILFRSKRVNTNQNWVVSFMGCDVRLNKTTNITEVFGCKHFRHFWHFLENPFPLMYSF